MSTPSIHRHLRETADAARATSDLALRRLPGRVLGNGRYRTLITAHGTGASWLDRVALTPWKGDRVEDAEGWHVYLRDRERGGFWSVGMTPAPRAADHYETGGGAGSFELTRRDDGLETRLEAWVDADLPLETRVLTIRNHEDRPRFLELTSVLEVVLLPQAAHAAHPGFSKLFVQTRRTDSGILAARRRPRGADEIHPELAQSLRGPGELQIETDRIRFVGRARSLSRPAALIHTEPLSGTTGSVLDPLFAMRRAFTLAPRETATFVLELAAGDRPVELLTGRAPGKDERRAARTAADEAARGRFRSIGATEDYAARIESAVLALLDAVPAPSRPAPGSAAPWRELGSRFGFDPRTPVALAEPGASSDALEEALTIHALAEGLGVPAALVVVADHLGPIDRARLERARAVWIPATSMSSAERESLRALARVTVPDFTLPTPSAPRAIASVQGPARDGARDGGPGALFEQEPLRAFNGHGGFSADGREYVIRMPRIPEGDLRLPPRPWVNVIANPEFGCIVSERGAGCTWSGNSREFRLTPWSDDPVVDPHEEAFYLRDEQTRLAWSVFPGPRPGAGDYEMRHGFGYSRCRHTSQSLALDTHVFVAATLPVKVVRIRVTNQGQEPRRLSLFSYQRLVLGALPETSGRAVVTGWDRSIGLLHARSIEGSDLGSQMAWAAVVTEGDAAIRTGTDRAAFLGTGGSAEAPAAVLGADLGDASERVGDACFAMQVRLEVAPGATRECAFLLGTAPDLERARHRVARARRPGALDAALRSVTGRWNHRIERLKVETPVESLDLLLNGWLTYQTLSCRIWGRSAFYQSGGAFGFRDQLQDATALTVLDPEIARRQLLLHARHQFVEGDVLHWWHPPLSRGIRTRFADDLLWLPLFIAQYVEMTGDGGVLDARVPWLNGRPLELDEEEIFLLPEPTRFEGNLYQHACRAIERALTLGAHDLPLFGTGDWNDSMNRVGREGRGESVWMAFFLHVVIDGFAPICEARGDRDRARRYREHQRRLKEAVETAGWDGGWYRRGYFDDGAPLGSRESEECRIDALVQAWAVLSGVAPRERAERAMDEVEAQLISDSERLVRLLTPPFDRSSHDPGYIQGYVPGVRENGGQYTHAALWVARALLELGRRDRGAQVLEMLTPVAHTQDEQDVATYQAEPYAVAADVYGEPPHVGRAGWTWYTGSSGWMLRVGLESLLGIRVEGGAWLAVCPAIPDHWRGFRVSLRPLGSLGTWHIDVDNPDRHAGRVREARLDGRPVEVRDGVARIPLDAGEGDHRVEVVLGP